MEILRREGARRAGLDGAVRPARRDGAARLSLGRPGLAFATVALTFAGAFGPSAAMPPPPAPRVVSIEPGPLDAALIELSTEAGVLVLVDPALVAGKRAPALKGAMTPDEALGRLLKGTDLSFRRNDGGGYVVVPAGAAAPVEERGTHASSQPRP